MGGESLSQPADLVASPVPAPSSTHFLIDRVKFFFFFWKWVGACAQCLCESYDCERACFELQAVFGLLASFLAFFPPCVCYLFLLLS